MKSSASHPQRSGVDRARRRARAAFTLAEVLAALAFMAIVIPVAVEGLRVANTAGQVGLRKAVATRVAERVLADWLAGGRTQSAQQRGTVQEAAFEYRWSVRTEPWSQDTMRVATAEVHYTVQGREYDVHVATLIDNSTP
jgi:hypothetical protein